MRYEIEFSKRARKQKEKLKSNKSNAVKNNIYNILDRLRYDPFGGHPELLNITNLGYLSRKVSRGDRVVYSVDTVRRVVIIMNMVGHYCDNGGRLS